VQILQGNTISECVHQRHGPVDREPSRAAGQGTHGRHNAARSGATSTPVPITIRTMPITPGRNIDARDGVLRLNLMSNSTGFINIWNTTHSGGTVRILSARSMRPASRLFIYPLNRADITQTRLRVLFNKADPSPRRLVHVRDAQTPIR